MLPHGPLHKLPTAPDAAAKVIAKAPLSVAFVTLVTITGPAAVLAMPLEQAQLSREGD